MSIQIDASALRQIWPRAPQTIIEAFASPRGIAALEAAGILTTRTRLAYALTQPEHETGGWTIKNLTENINYTPERAAQIWPGRFPGGAAQVRAKYGTAAGWQLKMFDDVYGNRMGNRPGTHDGSKHIGRGGPQVTGADGYREVQARTGIPVLEQVELCARHDFQPEILAAFWTWKKMNAKADVGDFKGCTRAWNGGLIGEADRELLLAGNDPVVQRLAIVDRTKTIAKDLPGAPPTPAPPPEVIAEATKKERAARAAGVASGGAGGASEGAKVAGTQQADKPADGFMPSVMAWSLLGAGIAVFLVAAVLIARKRALVQAHWF